MNQEDKVEAHAPVVRLLLLPLLRLIAGALLFLLGPTKVRGAYRVPESGGVLILSNHLADIDPVVVQWACKRPIHFMAKSELFGIPVLGWLIKVLKAFPVKRGEPDRTALKRAAELLKQGEVVCVFPEGQLSEKGEIQDVKAGVALIVRMAQVPVICLGLNGTNRIMPYGKVIPRPAFRTLNAEWGEPRQFEPHASAEEIMGWVKGQLVMLSGLLPETPLPSPIEPREAV